MARKKNIVKTLRYYYKGDDICTVELGRTCFGINDFIESETTDEVGIITAIKASEDLSIAMIQILIPYKGLQWRLMAVHHSGGRYRRLWRHRRSSDE